MFYLVADSIDKDGSLSVDWAEWRSFFQLYPGAELEDLVQFWRQSLVSNHGNTGASLLNSVC